MNIDVQVRHDERCGVYVGRMSPRWNWLTQGRTMERLIASCQSVVKLHVRWMARYREWDDLAALGIYLETTTVTVTMAYSTGERDSFTFDILDEQYGVRERPQC